MIQRYSREEMAKIWDLHNRFQCMLDVEIAACKAMNELGMIPDEDLKNIEVIVSLILLKGSTIKQTEIMISFFKLLPERP